KFKPAFQQTDLLGKSVACYSSNYELYAQMSTRLFQCLQSTGLLAQLHAYSIDECFAALPTHFQWDDADLLDVARQIRRRAWDETRLPCGVGIGRTFTLAKVASYLGKNGENYRGICVMSTGSEDTLLQKVPVSEVWMVGKATAATLQHHGVKTAWELKHFSTDQAKAIHGINLVRTIQELRGEPVYTFDSFPDVATRQEVTSSLSLKRRATSKQALHQALSQRIAVAAEKLRNLTFTASTLVLYANSNQHRGGYRSFQKTHRLGYGIDDTRVFITALSQHIDALFEENVEYYKVGCRLMGLEQRHHQQVDMFAPQQNSDLMAVMDGLNKKFGHHVLTVGAQKVASEAAMIQSHLSPCYLTRWSDIPTVSC
ncbi:DUF4113 domain-containing protein, partial [Vibrio mediterranei]